MPGAMPYWKTRAELARRRQPTTRPRRCDLWMACIMRTSLTICRRHQAVSHRAASIRATRPQRAQKSRHCRPCSRWLSVGGGIMIRSRSGSSACHAATARFFGRGDIGCWCRSARRVERSTIASSRFDLALAMRKREPAPQRPSCAASMKIASGCATATFASPACAGRHFGQGTLTKCSSHNRSASSKQPSTSRRTDTKHRTVWTSTGLRRRCPDAGQPPTAFPR